MADDGTMAGVQNSTSSHPKGLPGRKNCILSIDGGGVRGIITTIILERLESELQKLEGEDVRIADYFDLIAGTSTGALVACLLVAPDPVTKRPRYTAKDATDFYLKNAATIFPQKSVASWITCLKGPKYSPIPLETLLKEVFGDMKLTDTIKPVIIPSYDIKYQDSVLFSTTQAKSTQIPNCYIRDVCRASSAAPTYFPPYYFTKGVDGVEREYNMVDGGIAANNPAYVAMCELLKDHVDESGQELKYEDLMVLSLGTGQNLVSYQAKTASKWGLLSWVHNGGGIPMLDILMTASQDIVDYSVSNAFYEQSCQDNYLRIQMNELVGSQVQMDDPSQSNLQSLVSSTQKLLESEAQTRNRLGQFVKDKRWDTYDSALSQYAKWLVEERTARLAQQL